MKNKLMAKFLPVHYRQEAFIDYHSFRQGTSMSVEDFTGEFDRLRMRYGVDEEEEQTVARYLASLKPVITDVVHLQQYWSYNDVCRLSLKVEGQLKKKYLQVALLEMRWVNVLWVPTRLETHIQVQLQIQVLVKTRIPTRVLVREGLQLSKRCYKCQGLGHFAADCPSRQIVTILEEDFGPVFDEYGDEVKENVFYQEEITYADSGEALVKGNEVRVFYKGWFSEFLYRKKYSDEVWCDVVPMDACHMLLGRPWQFDRKTMHDGYKNTYSFKKDGETIILGPYNIRNESKNQLLSQAEFLAEAQDATNVADPMRDIPSMHRLCYPGCHPKATYRMNPKEHA
ncbi:reverse transcriptase domain-containing protein [Tanacetum coccineum]